MLRNLKVGTKLFVILLAPVVVIVALVAVGVRDRRADASDAARVEELSSFALVGTDLVSQLQVEQIRSALYSASRGATGRTELDAQRTVVPGRPGAAVDLAGREDEAAPLAQVDDGVVPGGSARVGWAVGGHAFSWLLASGSSSGGTSRVSGAPRRLSHRSPRLASQCTSQAHNAPAIPSVT